MWLITHDDLCAMYTKYQRGLITLWCNSRSETGESESVSGQAAKRKRDETSTRRQDKKDEVEDVYQDLRHKHAGKFSAASMG